MRTLFRRCVLFYISRLMPRKKVLNVKIIFDDKLYSENGMIGSCLADDHPYDKKHREFTIGIDSGLNLPQTLAVLAHEMAHVRQYATGQMGYDYTNTDITIWNGKRYDERKIAYENQPWEIDAKMYEANLLHELLTTTQLWK
jgi:hypothetical protein